MITVDTSILVRYFVQDDEQQARLASYLLEEQLTESDPGLVPLVAVHETAWVLRRIYRLGESAIIAIMTELLAVPTLVVEHRDVVRRALDAPAGFADALLHFSGLALGSMKTLTFDKRFARLDGVELLA